MNWFTNSPPYGYGGRKAETSVLPVRIIMSPTCSKRFLVGRKTLSAVARTNFPLLPASGRAAHGTCAPEEYGIAASGYNTQPPLTRFTPWYVPADLRGRRAQRRIGARAFTVLAGTSLLLTGLLTGCGNNKKQDVNEPKGAFPVAVEKATFPAKQAL